MRLPALTPIIGASQRRAEGAREHRMNLFDAYRKMFASFDDEEVVWW